MLRRQRTQAQWPVLHGYSPTIVARPADWRAGLDVVGYWWPAGPSADWRPPAELTDFLGAGPAPVFVGFGSTMVAARDAERLSEEIRDGLRRAGVRGIVQAGWACLGVSDDDVLTIGEIPHDWLFPRMAAVAHHCGAGTVAAGLRAGVPTIAIPGLGDQPFWARHLYELGASTAPIPQRRLNAERLAEAVNTATTDHQIRDTARELADRIAGEDGAARVVATVESLINSTPEVHDGH
jgi:sterol 3beta-glucosyltransferase